MTSPARLPLKRSDQGPAKQHRTAGGTGRTCIGFGLAGQGLAILSGVVPHEEVIVGLGLLAFGCVLVATGTLPKFPAVRPWHLLVLGVGMLAVVAAAWAWTGHAPMGPLLLLAILGLAIVGAGTFHARVFRMGRHALPLRDLAPWVAVAIGVPILVWTVQAAFKHLSGTTPVETFLIVFLVTPVHWILGGFGLKSTVAGQFLTIEGPQGPMPVEIGVACSGFQAMALFLGILALFAVTQRPSGRRLLTWTVVGLVGVYIANVLRLIVILLAGHWWGADALESFHADAGWAFFVAWSLVFALWVRRGLPAAG